MKDMDRLFAVVWDKTVSKLSAVGMTQKQKQEKEFAAKVKDACRQVQAAYSCFNQVYEPQQVDATIKVLAAAEDNYRFLLQEARRLGYRVAVTPYGFKERRG